jgi:hypothetical protein
VTTQFQDLPTPKTFGYGFNYAVWSANTTVTLANVTWNNDYRDVVTFGAGGDPALWRSRLDNYIDNLSGPVTVTNGVTYAAMGRPIRLQIPFEVANTYNYLRAYNPAQPLTGGGDTGRSYYYFVVGVNYIAPDTTELMLQLDVFASFGPDAQFGNIYLERGHAGIANEDAFDNYGRDYLTVPEGFDLGNEYEIRHLWSLQVGSARFDTPGIPGLTDYAILVASTTALDEDPGTVDAPRLTSAKGSSFENLPNGCEIYEFNEIDHFKAFMEYMFDKPWITQGIISVQAVPRLGRYGAQYISQPFNGPLGQLAVSPSELAGGPLKSKKTAVVTNWRNQIDLGRYWRLSKFATSPYMVIEMTANTGTPLVLKPECWQDDHMDVVEVPHFAPPNARLGFYPYRYNTTNTLQPTEDDNGIIHDGGEHYALMTAIMNFPAFSVVNNGYMMFMASNANSIAYQHSSADWSQQRALRAGEIGYAQTDAGLQNATNQTAVGMTAAGQSTNLANETMAAHTMVNGVAGMVGGAARGLAMGPAGAVGGALGGALNFAQSGVNTAIDMNARNQQLGINNTAAMGSLDSTLGSGRIVRDTNWDLAQFSANGDYANAIAGINAKVQDAKMSQPTTAGQIGGDAFNLATYRWGVDLKVKMLQPQVMAAIGEFWLRYGYAVNRFSRMPASLMVMDKFTYWKCKEVYITNASCPETYKQTLRGIFEKGVTVWKNPTDIGNIDTATNTPLAGVRI